MCTGVRLDGLPAWRRATVMQPDSSEEPAPVVDALPEAGRLVKLLERGHTPQAQLTQAAGEEAPNLRTHYRRCTQQLRSAGAGELQNLELLASAEVPQAQGAAANAGRRSACSASGGGRPHSSYVGRSGLVHGCRSSSGLVHGSSGCDIRRGLKSGGTAACVCALRVRRRPAEGL